MLARTTGLTGNVGYAKQGESDQPGRAERRQASGPGCTGRRSRRERSAQADGGASEAAKASEAAAAESSAATTAAISSGVASPRMTRRTGPESVTTARSAEKTS